MLPLSPRDLTHASSSSSSSSSSIDPYQVLQIRRDATAAEIQQAYKRLALLHHPVRKRRKGSPAAHEQSMQLFEILAACYETLMDKEARLRCDLLLQDQEKALLHRSLSWKRNNKNKSRHKKVVGLFILSNKGQMATGDGPGNDNNMLGFVGVNNMPSLAEMSSCGGSSMDESFLTQDDQPVGDWTNGCVTEAHHIDGQEQVEIVYSLDDYDDDNGKEEPLRNLDRDILFEREKDRCASPATADHSSLRPLRILHSEQSSWDEDDDDAEDAIPFSNATEAQIQPASDSHSTDSEKPHEEASPNADIHYSGAEIDRMFGGPLQLLFRARRWQVFRDPFEVFAEVFGGPLYGSVRPTAKLTATTTTPTPPKNANNNPNFRTAFQLPPPMEKLPSEHVSRRMTIHRTRRVAWGKEIVRTAVVRINPRTKQRHVTISVATEDSSIVADPEDESQQQWNSFFQFLDSVCVGKSEDGNNGTCFFFDFSICT